MTRVLRECQKFAFASQAEGQREILLTRQVSVRPGPVWMIERLNERPSAFQFDAHRLEQAQGGIELLQWNFTSGKVCQ